uniref:3-deoxy-D-manno-octulosonic acid transferase n=1 Tax=Castellaniella defragrans TaxID=75697 RepID=UPI0033421E23
MNRFFYSVLIRALSPALLVWMALRARKAGGHWEACGAARFGHYAGAAPAPGAIWIHAVSLGETRAAQPFVRAVLDRGHRVLLTHLTATGRAEGARAFSEDIAQGRLIQEWLPYDFPGATRRFIARHRPLAGVLIEREVWPNLIHAASRAGVPMILASARMSNASLRQSLRMGRIMREAYGRFQGVYAQSLLDARRLERAGAVAVRVSGNFKFDLRLDRERVARGGDFAARLGRKTVAIASTREGEDALFIQAMRHQIERVRQHGIEPGDEALFYLIPRHPARFDEAAEILRQAGLPFVRRSELIQLGDGGTSAIQACQGISVVLGDTLGEMAWYYAACQVAIVGGSFVPLGGQNFIEASALGKPVLVGPHTANFEQAVADALKAGAIECAADADQAVQRALQWLEDPRCLARMGEAGSHWVRQHTGAVDRVVNGLEDMLRV